MGLLGLNKNPKYKQGYYNPINPHKYIGKAPIIYRSGLELKFMLWCDKTDTIQKWSSESIAIPYYDPVKKYQRKYYVDNYVEILEGDVLKRYLVEIKPYKQTIEPKATRGKKKSNLLYEQMQWITNSQGKWPACKEFAKKYGAEFIIITENELK